MKPMTRKRRRAFIESYEFPAALRAKLRQRLDNEHQVAVALEGGQIWAQEDVERLQAARPGCDRSYHGYAAGCAAVSGCSGGGGCGGGGCGGGG